MVPLSETEIAEENWFQEGREFGIRHIEFKVLQTMEEATEDVLQGLRRETLNGLLDFGERDFSELRLWGNLAPEHENLPW